MYIHEYGDPKDPTLVLMTPMMVSGEELYEMLNPYFTGKYHIIAPDQGAHGKAGPYKGPAEEYDTLKKYLQEHGYTEIRLVLGISLGVTMAYRLFRDPAFTVEKAWFDGVCLTENGRLMNTVMRHTFRSRKKTLAKTHAEASPNLVKMYGYDFAKKMTGNFHRMTLEEIDRICDACTHYDLYPLSVQEAQKIHLEYGSGDPTLKMSKKTLQGYWKDVTPIIREGYGHGGYVAHHPKEYAEQMEAWIRQ